MLFFHKMITKLNNRSFEREAIKNEIGKTVNKKCIVIYNKAHYTTLRCKEPDETMGLFNKGHKERRAYGASSKGAIRYGQISLKRDKWKE